jgi:hypothetical protein
MGVHYPVLSAFAGKLSSQTAIVVDGKNQIRNFTPPLPCHIEIQFFVNRFLIVPSCPTPLLDQDIMKKLRVVLVIGHLPELLML